MRDATHRLLYMVAHSNAMNGLAEGIIIRDITPAWIVLLNTLEIVFIALTALAALSIAVTFVLLRIKK